jgi:DNA topoisomerase II
MSREVKNYNWKQHGLLRPGMFIGSIRTVREKVFVYHPDGDRLVKEELSMNPGLMKIFLEVVSNAVDNIQANTPELVQSYITISIDDEGVIEVSNDGNYISTEKTEYAIKDPNTGKVKRELLHPAVMCFSRERSSTNYISKEEGGIGLKSGQNGLGAKFTNLYSKWFEVEHCDGKKKLVVKFRDNVSEWDEPVLTSSRVKSYTTIRFLPEYERFGVGEVEVAEFKRLVQKTALDVSLNIPVWFDGMKLPKKTLAQYAKLYFGKCPQHQFDASTDEVASTAILVDISSEEDSTREELTVVSFVNGMGVRSGLHTKAWENAIISPLVRGFNKAAKTKRGGDKLGKLTAKALRPHLALFVWCQVRDPEFDAQIKDHLTGPPNPVATTSPDETTLKKIYKWPAVILASQPVEKRVKNVSTRGKSIPLSPKYDDAIKAGEEPENCTLWFTEGDSAKTFGSTGIAALDNGHDYNGLLALKGKMLNAAKHSSVKCLDNAEIQLIRMLLGAQVSIDYASTDGGLRYHQVGILTDSDEDGVHIAALIINFFYTIFPSLLKRKGFLRSMSTASVIDVKNKRRFYSLGEFKRWMSSHPDVKVNAKYIKGLGTNTNSEAMHSFRNPKELMFNTDGEETRCMMIGMTAEMMAERKEWITQGMRREGETAPQKHDEFPYSGQVSISRFINERLVQFHRASMSRGIPSVYDGLKTPQRKILHGCLCMKLFDKGPGTISEVKVEQVAGYVTQNCDYHHSTDSLKDTIMTMAQWFPGSNNIPLLVGVGNFGTRAQASGKDHASARYCYMFVDKITQILYPQVEFGLLENNIDDNGYPVEPRYYLPILPMLLINGADGITGGFSTSIPLHNPLEVVKRVRNWLDEVEMFAPLVPWHRGFIGTNTLKVQNSRIIAWSSTGKLEKLGESKKGTSWRITEIPIGLSVEALKTKLENLRIKHPSDFVGEVESRCHNNSVDITFTASTGWNPSTSTGHLKFLTKTKKLSNMVALDGEGFPIKFDSARQILEMFCPKRLAMYETRRLHLIKVLRIDLDKLSNQIRFIDEVASGELNARRPKKELHQVLVDGEYSKHLDSKKGTQGFAYLTSLPIGSLVEEKIEKLKKKREVVEQQIEELENTTPKEMWLKELDEFEEAYQVFLKEVEERDTGEIASEPTAKGKRGGKKKTTRSKK